MLGMGAVEILIAVALVTLVGLVLLPGGWTYDVVDEAVVEGVSAEAADQVLFRELSEVRGLPLVESHAGSFTLATTTRSAGTYVVALLLFPVGLLLLMSSREHRVQVSVVPHPRGCRVRVVGHARRRDIDQVASAIERVLPVPVIAR